MHRILGERRVRYVVASIVLGIGLAACSGSATTTTSSPTTTTAEQAPTTQSDTATTTETSPSTTSSQASPPVTQAPFSTLPAFEYSEEADRLIAEALGESMSAVRADGLARFVLDRIPVSGSISGFTAVWREPLTSTLGLELPDEGMSRADLVDSWISYRDAFFDDWPAENVASVSPEEWRDTFGWSELSAEVIVGIHELLPSSSGLVLFGGFAPDEAVERMMMSPVWEPDVEVATVGRGLLVGFGEDPLGVDAQAATASGLWSGGRGGHVGITEDMAIRSLRREVVAELLEFDRGDGGERAEAIAGAMNLPGLVLLSVAQTPDSATVAGYTLRDLVSLNPAADLGVVAEGIAITPDGLTVVLMVETDRSSLDGLDGFVARSGGFLVQKVTVSG